MTDRALDHRLRLALRDEVVVSHSRRAYNREGKLGNFGWRYHCRRRQIGSIRLPSGRIVVGCPSMLDLREAFRVSVAPGTYTVWATQAIGDDTRNAFVTLQFGERSVARWEVASTLETKEHVLPVQSMEGFGVDSGQAWIMDALTAEFLLTEEGRAQTEVEMIGSELEHASVAPPLSPPHTETLMVVESGMGDGVYNCYWGFDADNAPVCLVLDFNLAGESSGKTRSLFGFLGSLCDWWK
ncbi:MAG: DUF4241 domain-containing protein [Phycisphaerales bacterium]|nr:DUF4241 domain-containing protein [Phycisphaerales bacterium]